MYCDEAMQHLKSEGVVVYLKISLKLLAKRLGILKDVEFAARRADA